ncbi:hypothetical protein ACG04Q_17885 [Roseateles sp. DXS20W]|uniref:PRTase-CE domain-containing protein n=1 Tax=Pelomonas lactea TaxID=3299030 RepID=A0ABW7GND3_9BURK
MSAERLAQEIALDFPWIGSSSRRVTSLVALLEEAEQARVAQGPALIASLLERFTFLSVEQYEQSLLDMAHFIDETFDLTTTVLCATTADRHKDSAQRVLYDLVSSLAAIGRYKVRSLNRYDVAAKEKSCSCVLLVDEFIGSGKSFEGRVRTLRRMFLDKQLTPPSIHGIAIAGMTQGLRAIEHNFDSLNVCYALKKGIKDYSDCVTAANEYLLMNDLESQLAPHFADEMMPSLGYAASEALYSRHTGSCPNNVFPIFWWPQRVGDLDRRPLLPRAL